MTLFRHCDKSRWVWATRTSIPFIAILISISAHAEKNQSVPAFARPVPVQLCIAALGPPISRAEVLEHFPRFSNLYFDLLEIKRAWNRLTLKNHGPTLPRAEVEKYLREHYLVYSDSLFGRRIPLEYRLKRAYEAARKDKTLLEELHLALKATDLEEDTRVDAAIPDGLTPDSQIDEPGTVIRQGPTYLLYMKARQEMTEIRSAVLQLLQMP